MGFRCGVGWWKDWPLRIDLAVSGYDEPSHELPGNHMALLRGCQCISLPFVMFPGLGPTASDSLRRGLELLRVLYNPKP